MTSGIRHFPAFCQNESENSQMWYRLLLRKRCAHLSSKMKIRYIVYHYKMKNYTWIWICSTHALYVFWKENYLNLWIFSLKMAFLQFFANFKLSSYDTNHFNDQTEWIFRLLIYSLFDWQGFEIQVKSSIFWASWL